MGQWRRVAMVLSIVITVGFAYYFTTWRPDCDAWRVKANARLNQVNTLGPNSELAGEMVLRGLESQRPVGCYL